MKPFLEHSLMWTSRRAEEIELEFRAKREAKQVVYRQLAPQEADVSPLHMSMYV